MAYDEALADRIRVVIAKRRMRVEEKKMFGGLCFLIGGNMSCGIVDDELMLRVGPDAYESTLAKKHARAMDFTGRPMRGMVYVAKAGFRTEKQLAGWLDLGFAFAGSLPAKLPKPGGRKPAPTARGATRSATKPSAKKVGNTKASDKKAAVKNTRKRVSKR